MAWCYGCQIVHLDSRRPEGVPHTAEKREETDVLSATRLAQSAGVSSTLLDFNYGLQLSRLRVVACALHFLETDIARLLRESREDGGELWPRRQVRNAEIGRASCR